MGLLSYRPLLDFGMALSTAVLIADMIKIADTICLLRLMGKRESNSFVNDCGTHYSNLHSGIRNEINRL